MARIESAELPIRSEPIKGPAVDAWNARREDNNNERFTSVKFRKNFEDYKNELFADVKQLIEGLKR